MRRNVQQAVLDTINQEAVIIINVIIDRIKRSGITIQTLASISGLTPAYLSNFLNRKYKAEKIKLETILVLSKIVGLKIDIQYSDNKIHHLIILDDKAADRSYI